MSEKSDAAFSKGMGAALEWMERARTTDFARFTEAEARSLFGYFLDTYTLEIMKTWDHGLMQTIGTPAE